MRTVISLSFILAIGLVADNPAALAHHSHNRPDLEVLDIPCDLKCARQYLAE
jgi:hypothetical protein